MLRFASLIFTAMAFMGPLLRLATWPPSRFEKATSSAVENFVYDLVLYLWPTQPLAVIESNASRALAGLVAVGGNVLLFLVLGLLVGAASKRRGALTFVYAAVCGFLILIGLWGSGYDIEHLAWFPLITAMVLYAVPFWLVHRAARATYSI